jgi:8-oxo-dGTP pyrophosphatase MutT (NUDIX family)
MVLADTWKAWKTYRPRPMNVRGCICIRKDNKILLVKGRQHNRWSFPKGHFKGNETSHECALRELYEETGISLDTSTPYIGVKKLPNAEYFIYEFDTNVETSIKDTCEVCDIGWFSLEDIYRLEVNRDVSCFSSIMCPPCSSPKESIDMS